MCVVEVIVCLVQYAVVHCAIDNNLLVCSFPQNGQSILHYACALGHHAILSHMLSLSNCEIFLKDRVS